MTHGAVDLSSLTQEQQEALEDLTERISDEEVATPPTNHIEVTTAFLVAQNRDGAWIAMPIPNEEIRADRAPTPDDMYAGTSVVQKDIITQESAMHTQRLMMQMGQVMQQQAQEAQLRAQVSQLGNLRL